MVVLIALAIVLSAVLRLDVMGLAVGAALTYGWVGLHTAAGAGIAGIVEQCVIVAIVLVVIALAITRRRMIAPADQTTDIQNSRSSAESMPRKAS
jgi:uncharacterized membrane protein